MAGIRDRALGEVLFGTGTGRHRGRRSRPGHKLFLSRVSLGFTGGLILRWLIVHDLFAGLLVAISLAPYAAIALFAFFRFRSRLMGGLGRAGGRGPDGDGRPLLEVPGVVWRWRALGGVARLMPRAAGRRWRGEAESALFEMDPGQRPAAVRSYLRSAPRVVAMMWARDVSGRVRRRTG